MEVHVIKATRPEFEAGHRPNGGGGMPGQLRVAAYCRVSTDSDEQEASYEAQVEHYARYIAEQPGWVLAGIYADEGITGTSTRKREQFNALIADCEAGRIDLVITKSISRWARNTLDSLKSIRTLKGLGIPILFEKENINTMDSKGEVLITIMSSIAQQESESISKNVRMGIRYRMQQGKARVNVTRMLGLTVNDATGELEIVPQEADLVRRIYRDYLNGFSPGMIARRLTEELVVTPGGKRTWHQSTIASILENEKYAGDSLMQKYFVKDFLTHKVVRNTGQLPRYLIEESHAPIVPKDVFLLVQDEIKRRSALMNTPVRLRFGAREALQGRLVCGLCGRTLKRYTIEGTKTSSAGVGGTRPGQTGAHAGPAGSHPGQTDAGGIARTVSLNTPSPISNESIGISMANNAARDDWAEWRCRERAYKKKGDTRTPRPKCACRNVPENEIKQVILDAFNQLPAQRIELLLMRQDLHAKRLHQLNRMLSIVEQRLAAHFEHAQPEAHESPRKPSSQQPHFAHASGGMLSRLETARVLLAVQRAQAIHDDLQIRFLLELIDAMSSKGDRASRTRLDKHFGKANAAIPTKAIARKHDAVRVVSCIPNGALSARTNPACYQADDFFERTRYVPDAQILDEFGTIGLFCDDAITPFLDRIIIEPNRYDVVFKAGVAIKIDVANAEGKQTLRCAAFPKPEAHTD